MEQNRSEGFKYAAWGLVVTGMAVGAGMYRAVSKTLSKAASGSGSSSPPAVSARVIASEELGRAADRETEQTRETASESSQDFGTFLVISAFSLAIAAGIGFLFVYWTGGSNTLLGGTMALSCGFFGAGLVFWAHWLMRKKEAIEPREPLPSSPDEREELSKEFDISEHQIRRRKLLTGMTTAVVGTFAAAFVSLFRSLASPPGPALFPTVWKRGERLVDEKGDAISVNALEPGSSVTVFPENRIGSVDAQTVLIRVKEQLLRLPKERADWAPMGYVAYSRVCTHAGCPVGEFETETDLLLCPCHQSTFNVLQAAQPTAGPAARALPQLPLYVDQDGILCAAGDFTQPPGPGFWGMPS